MFELKVVIHFAAAHQLKMVAKKCENLHGNNWKIEVCVAGENLNDAGVLVDFGELKQNVSEIMTRLDHNFLNELDYFNDQNPPSSENIALYIANSLQAMLKDPKIRVTSVTAWELENACAKYLMVNPFSTF
ncbi:MAG: 6-carboxytetrahydropterin synthase QueD [Methanosarcina sp.]|jgi:6-pyruvoyltetrahydropterin/6-carboxytetrahydropterin synthase|nr:6-carboxytetrahydropterin synthase QueD [Methanosarcina sp.]MDD3874578.1 6-carboxytetrahydropterin synthase QueD [Methanosarcina sp.]MDD4524068.1 6-carboxytetrahydropterin synthase QueD [Methanosarcina sp.]